MATRLYVAKNKEGVERLICAGNPAIVGRHIASDWEIKPAGSEDVWRLASKGVKREDVKPMSNDPEAA
jgi:hypothetical protein